MEQDVRYISSLYGGFWNFDITDFCYLVNPYFPPRGFTKVLRQHLDELLRSYPSTNWYNSALLANGLGITDRNVVIGNGASELISAIISRYVDNLAIPIPTFDEYINRSEWLGKRTSLYQMKEVDDFNLDVEGFLAHVRKSGANSALIINPNNPTGGLIDHGSIWHILESLRHLDLVILDESFMDFAGGDPLPSAQERLCEFPNLTIVKSLSKAYGIAGLRLGYILTSNRDMISTIRRDVPIWSINALAQFFLEQMPAYKDQFGNSCNKVHSATQRLFKNLESIPYLRPTPSQGNFILCKTINGFTAAQLTNILLQEQGFLINDCSKKKGLNGNYIRIASRTNADNTKLVKTLRSISP